MKGLCINNFDIEAGASVYTGTCTCYDKIYIHLTKFINVFDEVNQYLMTMFNVSTHLSFRGHNSYEPGPGYQ